MDNIAGSKSIPYLGGASFMVLALVLLWLFPTVGLLVSSFRTADQISASGWWKALFGPEPNRPYSFAPAGPSRGPRARAIFT